MEPFLSKLTMLLQTGDVSTAAVTAEICLSAATLDWAHRVPFDRIQAATALHHFAAIISADTVFDTLPRLRRVS